MDTTTTTTTENSHLPELSSELFSNEVENENLLTELDPNQGNTSTQGWIPPAPWQTSFSTTEGKVEQQPNQGESEQLQVDELQTQPELLDAIENQSYEENRNEEQEESEALRLKTSVSLSPPHHSAFGSATSPRLLTSSASDFSSSSSSSSSSTSSLSSQSSLHPWNNPSLPSKPSSSFSTSSLHPTLPTNGTHPSRLPHSDPSSNSIDTSMIHPSRRPWFTTPSNTTLPTSSSSTSNLYPTPSSNSSYRPTPYYRSSTSTMPPSSSSSSSIYPPMYSNRTLVNPALPVPSFATSSSYYRPSMYTSSTPYAYSTTATTPSSSSFSSYSSYPSSSSFTSSSTTSTLPSTPSLQSKPPSIPQPTHKRSTKSLSHHGHYFDMQQYQDEVNQRKAQEKLLGSVEKKRKVTKKEIAQFKAKKLDQKKKKFMAKYTEM